MVADAAKLNQTPIAPNGSGSSYSYTDQLGDAACADGQSYSYWVEETKADGTTVAHGPVEVRIGGSQLSPVVMLPFVVNKGKGTGLWGENHATLPLHGRTQFSLDK